jgi:hypothetical protein
MYGSMLNFPGLFGDFERLRRELDDWFDAAGAPSSIRSVAPGAFPAINIGNTPTSVEVYAFAPGIDPACPTATAATASAASASTAASGWAGASSARSTCPKTPMRRR